MIRGIGSILISIALAATLAGCAGSRDRYADTDSYGSARDAFFYDELSPYGRWYALEPYGWVWSPYGTSVGWRPYTVGSWAYSDWGWTWLSDDPWGWETYHYGRWGYDAFHGWFWAPDDVWGPAWVAWRYGDGWAGWAPLPADAVWRSGLSYDPSWIDESRWCFVRERDLVASRIRTHVLPASKNRSLLRATKDVTRYAAVEGQAAERGFDPTLIARRTGRPVPRYRLVPKEKGLNREIVRGKTLEVPRPAVVPKGLPPAREEALERGREKREEALDRVREKRDALEREKREKALEREREIREQREQALEREREKREQREQARDRAREKREQAIARAKEERKEALERERERREQKEEALERERERREQKEREGEPPRRGRGRARDATTG